MIVAQPFLLAPAANGTADWITPAGALADRSTGFGVVQPVQARSRRGRPIRYALVAGTLPPGLSLDPSNGIISGTITANTVNTTMTYSFTLSAHDI